MKKSKFFPLFLILALLAGLLAVPSHAAADPAVAAPHALVLDGGSGAVLFAKDADARIYPASTTKIMTALLTVEAVERGDVRADEAVTAPAEAFSDLIAEGSTAGIRPGETLTVRQLLDCAMVASANEACNILAIRLAGSIAAFAARMNERAAALGCADTHFVNTHGLPDSGHFTTPA